MVLVVYAALSRQTVKMTKEVNGSSAVNAGVIFSGIARLLKASIFVSLETVVAINFCC